VAGLQKRKKWDLKGSSARKKRAFKGAKGSGPGGLVGKNSRSRSLTHKKHSEKSGSRKRIISERAIEQGLSGGKGIKLT